MQTTPRQGRGAAGLPPVLPGECGAQRMALAVVQDPHQGKASGSLGLVKLPQKLSLKVPPTDPPLLVLALSLPGPVTSEFI
ncbi:hypothetical protein E2C01_072272 [Portunus trituberculatus]|uniref:Uncharacterized protein n=1 Tax=Portunus trituberculatus TaxID=210409 RepID=A0A5B7I6P6_PORTR|nr:hypothetical protein [Portunus trituberculatus]